MPKSRSKRQRRQPPPKAKRKHSPDWVAPLFFVMLVSGVVVIVSHYLGILPDGTQPWQLYYGLGLIAGSFVVATQWR